MDGIEKIKILASEIKNEATLNVIEYLISRVDMNEKYLNEEKSLKQMISFIRSEVLKKAENGMAFVENEYVYNLAIHYWNESNKDLGLEKENIKSEAKKVETTKKVENIVKSEPKKNKEWIPEGQLSLF